MIDLVRLRQDASEIGAFLRRKDPEFDIDRLIELDKTVRSLSVEVESLRQEKNELARSAGPKGVTEQVRERSKEVGRKLKEKERIYQETNKEFRELYLSCPNIPFDDVQPGGKESNKPVRVFGEKPTFDFPVKNHVELLTSLDWVDFEAAARMTASHFVFYKSEMVSLMYALTVLMLKNNKEHGFEPVIPPYMVNAKALEAAGNFPKFKEDVFEIEKDGLYASPTSEVNLTSVYRDQILSADQLPARMTAWTSCFRREAGGYGASERGLIRIHEFEKVELYSLVEPENAAQEHERMIACAEKILQKLGLHYRVSRLAAQDCSFSSAKTYDIEVWMPGQGAYFEVSSASNCTDFQSRRAAIRYRKKEGQKPQLVYTLNASSLALPRLMVALVETYQQADGSVVFPDVLKKEAFWL
jgi:seryl-tRNA synthetase